MFNFFKNKFNPQTDSDRIFDYIEDVLKARIGVEQATPPIIEPLPSPDRLARKRVGFGRGRDYDVTFYPAHTKFTEGDERIALHDLLRNRIPVPKIAVDDRSAETRKKFGFDVVACSCEDLRPLNNPWTADDLHAAAGLLFRLNSISGAEGGRSWNPTGASSPLKTIEQRWDSALQAVSSILGLRINPIREAPFREKALGRLENAAQYDLTHGAPGPQGFLRTAENGMLIGDYSHMSFAYREWDLVVLEQLFFGGPCPASRAMIARYMESASPPVQKRYELLRPFFLGLGHLEQIHQIAARMKAVKHDSSAPKVDEAEQRAQARTLWDLFLDATGLPEK